MITRTQLTELGFTPEAIDHRREIGRLHVLWRGVYAVGRPDIGRYGLMMAAVLACGEEALLSHETAAELWRIRLPERGPIEVSVPLGRTARRPGIQTHRRSMLTGAASEHQRIPVTSPTLTLIDLAARLTAQHLEAAVNMADSRDLLDAERLRTTLEDYPRVPGVAPLRRLLDRDTFRLTDSELERMFLRLVRETGLPLPDTQERRGGHRCDFAWHDPPLIVETDSLRYHRTPITQRRDAKRDHDHLIAMRESVRFTHFQIAHEREHVRTTLFAAWRKAHLLRAA